MNTIEFAVMQLQELQKKLDAALEVIAELEFVEITGECVHGCGGDSSTGHNEDCRYIELLVSYGLMEVEEVAG